MSFLSRHTHADTGVKTYSLCIEQRGFFAFVMSTAAAPLMLQIHTHRKRGRYRQREREKGKYIIKSNRISKHDLMKDGNDENKDGNGGERESVRSVFH